MILPIVTISVVYCSPLTHSSLAYCHSSLLGIKPQVIITMEKETATHSSILTLESPLDCKKIKPVDPKGNQL